MGKLSDNRLTALRLSITALIAMIPFHILNGIYKVVSPFILGFFGYFVVAFFVWLFYIWYYNRKSKPKNKKNKYKKIWEDFQKLQNEE